MGILKNLASKYLDAPQMILASEFEKISELLEMKHGIEALELYFRKPTPEAAFATMLADPFYTGYKFDEESLASESPADYTVIKVEGALSYKPITAACAPDMCNYQELLKTVQVAAQEGKKQIFFIHDSGGGEAYNMIRHQLKRFVQSQMKIISNLLVM